MNRNPIDRARVFSLCLLAIFLVAFFFQIDHAEARGLELNEIFYELKTPDKLSRFMLENFTWDWERDDSPAYDPDSFLQIRSGVCRDFAVFAGTWLNLHGYFPEQVIIGYWSVNGQAAHAIVRYPVGEDQRGIRYCFFSNGENICDNKGFYDYQIIEIEQGRMKDDLRICNWYLRKWDDQSDTADVFC